VVYWKRPFDEQTQDRVYIESEIILSVIAKCETGEWRLLISEALKFELSNDKDVERSEFITALFCEGNDIFPITDEIKQRAAKFQNRGVKLFDSLHLATAEHANADALLTVDDQFVNSAKRTDSRVKVVNPINFMEGL